MKNAEKLIFKYGKLLGYKGYSPGVSGNISARVDDKILITATGTANGYLKEDDLTLIDFSGNPVSGSKKASSEKMLHAQFYKMRPDINFIIHVHPPYLSAFASAGIALDEPIMAENVFYFGGIPLAEYGLPSSMDLVHKTAKYFDKYNAVLMANHGFIIGSSEAEDAYLKLEIAETYAHTVLNTKILGGAKLLSQKQVEEINALK